MKLNRFLLHLVSGVALVLIMGPIFVVLLFAFSSADSLVFPPPGFSLRWFYAFFATPEMRSAFILSLVLAFFAACLSCLLGLLAAVYVSRRRGAWCNLLQMLFMAPLIFPTIILGLALLLLYRTIGMATLPGLLIAHVVVCLPYAFRAVVAALQSFDTRLEEAGRSLGAGPVKSFALITLPLVWPAVLSGWLFAFIVSFGELNVALFLTGPGVVTLPIEIFSYLQFQGSQLVVAAASALQVMIIVLILIAAERIIGTKRIVQR
ncbi:MAG: ABC transporter permease [Candidimonas sp.]|nr:MAG: ABC transporter permease [Candidimonas sp.]